MGICLLDLLLNDTDVRLSARYNKSVRNSGGFTQAFPATIFPRKRSSTHTLNAEGEGRPYGSHCIAYFRITQGGTNQFPFYIIRIHLKQSGLRERHPLMIRTEVALSSLKSSPTENIWHPRRALSECSHHREDSQEVDPPGATSLSWVLLQHVDDASSTQDARYCGSTNLLASPVGRITSHVHVIYDFLRPSTDIHTLSQAHSVRNAR